jgi:anti-sigma factor RsiW
LLTCRGLIARLADLSGADLAPEEIRESQRHLARCRSCAAYRRSYRLTVELAREAYRAPGGADGAEMPEVLIEEILAAARTRLSGLSPRAWRLVHLLAGIAAGPLAAFCLR